MLAFFMILNCVSIEQQVVIFVSVSLRVISAFSVSNWAEESFWTIEKLLVKFKNEKLIKIVIKSESVS